MDRRDFMQTALMGIGAALTGCTIPEQVLRRDAYACSQRAAADEMLRIDMHCHLINQDDANGAAFLARRYLPDNAAADLLGGIAIRSAVETSGLMVNSLTRERELLEDWITRPPRYMDGKKFRYSDAAFCTEMNASQRGFFLSGSAASKAVPGSGRPTGFTSGRLRNAALMMAFWPKIDIFMPAMVDFYEGRNGGYGEHPARQAKFYRDLHLATRGRFMPLISFNPERAVKESRQPKNDQMTALDSVEVALRDWGFVGVKVHPTAGFNPIDNMQYGCPNTALQIRERLTAYDAIAYDRAMEALYDLCEAYDVPILTHGSDSLSAHEACMHGVIEENLRYHSDAEQRIKYRDPMLWTNSTAHWGELLERRRQSRNLRICIAHYASRFQHHLAAKKHFEPEFHPDLCGEHGTGKGNICPKRYDDRPAEHGHVEYNPDGSLRPSDWLAGAMRIIEGDETRLALDLSHMVELCYSEAARTGEKIDRSGPFAYEIDDGGRYALAFRKHLRENPYLHKQILYGTDYHMPDVSTVGPSYQRLIEAVLDAVPLSVCEDIMGRNAAHFFGLAKRPDGTKSATRRRLEAFYDQYEVGDIGWIDRVDRRVAKS